MLTYLDARRMLKSIIMKDILKELVEAVVAYDEKYFVGVPESAELLRYWTALEKAKHFLEAEADEDEA